MVKGEGCLGQGLAKALEVTATVVKVTGTAYTVAREVQSAVEGANTFHQRVVAGPEANHFIAQAQHVIRVVDDGAQFVVRTTQAIQVVSKTLTRPR